MEKLTLYTHPQTRGTTAHWMLEEIGETYDIKWTALGPKGTRSADFKKINAMGKLPTLTHGNKVISETAAICLYLADCFPSAKLAPEPAEKADYYRWSFFSAGPLEHAVTNRAFKLKPTEDKSGQLGYGSFDLAIYALEKHFDENHFVCGSRFTAADVIVGSQVIWGLQFETIPELTAFENYRDRLVQRLAFKQMTKICQMQIEKS